MKFRMSSVFASVIVLAWATAAAAQTVNIDTLQKAAASTRDMCLSGRQYDLKANADGSLSLFRVQPGAEGNIRITQSEGTGGALNYTDEGKRLQADQNILTCITANLPVILTALGARLSPPPTPPSNCHDPSNGIESYRRAFEVTRDSGWRGGGYDPTRWCEDVMSILRGENPQSRVSIVAKSEQSKNTCAPFNCPQYLYACRVKVETDPVFKKSPIPACADAP